jgi:hypothetical protein
MVETQLTEIAGVPVREHCARGESPRCCFEVERVPTPHGSSLA